MSSFRFPSSLALLLASGCSLLLASSSLADELNMYIGTYTKPGAAQGIYYAKMDTSTGAISEPTLAVASESPSYLVQHPTQAVIYAVNEAGSGSVSAYAILAPGKLKELNHQPSLGGGPTHISIDREGQNVLIANYGGGSIAALPIAEDGSLKPITGFIQHKGSGPDKDRQKEPHAHSVYVNFENTHVYACDLGLDKVLVYRFKPADGSLNPADPPFVTTAPGAGPRHLAFGPEESYVYCISEMANTVTVFERDPKQTVLHAVQSISTLPADFKGKSSTAEVVMYPTGRFLYVSNRGHDSIVAYSVGEGGQLSLISHTPTQGKNPRFIGIEPTGRYLVAANQDSDNIVAFQIDAETGKLTPAGKPITCFSPVCVIFNQ